MKHAASLFAALLLLPHPPAPAASPEPAPAAYPWKAGAAAVKITPDKPMWMAGFASRTKPSEGVELDLFAKALALEDAGGKRLAFVTMDLIGIPQKLRKVVEDACAGKYQLAPENLVLNASHTHSGPEFRVETSLYLEIMDHDTSENATYGDKLARQLVSLVGEALQKLAPARVQYTHARCGFAMNRRLPTRLGSYNNSPFPDGPVDHDVPVLEVSSPDGKELRAVMFGYACHNTTLALQTFNGDYAGYAQRDLENAHPRAVALFMNGCSGDQNPYPRGTLELAQTHGKTLATAVDAALSVVQKRPVEGPIKAAFERIDLAFGKPPTKQDLEAERTSSNKWAAAHAKRQLAILEKEGHLEQSYPYPVQVIHLGSDIAMVTLGGEVVIDYALRIKRELGRPVVWMAGYSNDVMGYIPSLRVLKEGGYEGGGAMLYTAHPGPWGDKVEETIMGAVMRLNKTLSSK
jgi:neutral ceramidase